MDRFDCTIEQRSGALVAHLTGSLGISGGAQFKPHAHGLIERKPRALVLEMSGVDFIASPGIALLVEIGQAAPNYGGRVMIAAAKPLVAETLRRLRVDEVIPMHEKLEDALR